MPNKTTSRPRWSYQLLVVDKLVADTSLALADDDDLETARQLLPQAVAMLCEQQRRKDLGSRLHVAAAVELGQASPERSAILLGAGRRLTEHLDLQDELLLPELADLRDQLSARLGKRAFEHASERGAEMSLDDIAELLAGTEQPRSPRATPASTCSSSICVQNRLSAPGA